MAAPPDSTKVNPAMPRDSARRRRSRCSGLAQSAQPRWPPTDTIKAARPTGSARRASRFPFGAVMSGLPWTRRHIGRAGAGQRKRVDDLIEQILADAVGQRGLLEGQVVVDGV